MGLEIKFTHLRTPPLQECSPRAFLTLMRVHTTSLAVCHNYHVRINTSLRLQWLPLQVSSFGLWLWILLSLPFSAGGFPCDLSSLMSPTKGIDFHFVQFFFFFCKDGSDYCQTLSTSGLKSEVSSLAFFIQSDNLLLMSTFRPFTFLV